MNSLLINRYPLSIHYQRNNNAPFSSCTNVKIILTSIFKLLQQTSQFPILVTF